MCLPAGISRLMVFMDSIIQFKDYDHTLSMTMLCIVYKQMNLIIDLCVPLPNLIINTPTLP